MNEKMINEYMKNKNYKIFIDNKKNIQNIFI